MPDTKDEGGDGYSQHPAPAKTPPFRGPAGPAPARPPLRAGGPMTGRVTVPPFMPPIQQGGPLPGTSRQPGPVVRPYVAPAAPPRRTATPVMQAAIDDAALTASVTAEHTTRAVPYEGERYFAPVNSPLSSPAGLEHFSDDPASITVELRRAPQVYAAPVPPAPVSEPERVADPADEAIQSIDAYVMRPESSVEDETLNGETIAENVVAGMKESDLPAAPYFSIDPPASFAAAMPPMPSPEIVASPAEDVLPSPADIERERAALVDAIVGAVAQAAEDEDEDAARDQKIDRDAVRLFAADPFGDDAEGTGTLAPPSPFDDDPDISHNMMSGRINDFADIPYPAQRPTPMEPWAPPGFSRPWGATPGPIRSVTPPLGVPMAPSPVSEYPPVPPFANPRNPTPTHFTPLVPPARITPLANDPVPPRNVSRPTPVRSPTPVFVPIQTPLSVPAVPDLAGARAVAGALETVAAKIRAGHLVVSGEITEGLDEEATYAGYLAAALAALLGVRH
jgi:hypothetical protein